MRLVACGWHNPGDRFAAPSDPTWWGKEYELPLWIPLATYATAAANAGKTLWQWDDSIALADSAALSTELLAVQADLAAITAAKADKCLPYSVPRRAGVQPLPNAPCLVAIAAAQKGLPEKVAPLLPVVPNPFAMPAWALWLVGFYVARKLKLL